ncbi:MAG: winged helix-turn-helix domain-containing protein, partial [Candidatus Acidiferrales bacterium]
MNPRARSIHKHGVRLKLHGQPFEILLLLLERPGEVVTREELQAKLWPANTFVDFEHGVNTAVKKLRRTLGDSADEQRFIETVPRVGYRFIAPVDVTAPLLNAAVSIPQIIANDSGGTNIADHGAQRAWALRFWPILAGISIVLIVAAGAFLRRSRPPSRPQPSSTRVMLAVLPFENLTGDASQEYFSDGLTEEMIAQLGQLNPQRLGVIGRASVMHYRHDQDLQQIARDLGIQYVLEGSVRRDSQNVRIAAHLIRISDQSTVWSREYDRKVTSILVLQQEIAQEIADEIQLTLGDHKRMAPASGLVASATSYEAYDLYLKGRYSLNKRTAQGFQQAIDYFQQAIA